jgi:hypothetical protein
MREVHYVLQMRRYTGQNEVRFKVTDRNMKMYLETAIYLYENNVIDKSDIQSLGRWCLDQVCGNYRKTVIHANMMMKQEQRQKQMQQPPA